MTNKTINLSGFGISAAVAVAAAMALGLFPPHPSPGAGDQGDWITPEDRARAKEIQIDGHDIRPLKYELGHPVNGAPPGSRIVRYGPPVRMDRR